MAHFFADAMDLLRWLKENFKTEADAAAKMKEIVGSDRFDTDIAQSVRGIFDGENAEHGARTLFRILSAKNLVEGEAMSNEMKKSQGADGGLQKKASVEKFPERMLMEVRICPKLPRQGAAQGLVSTYNCRRFCKDSLVLDDDPHRVYCAEALWRRHVMDKFSREWLDPKTGLLQGGYINDRFVVYRDELPTGEPRNSARMSLQPGERTRQPKPYEYSMERRLEEQRDANSTKSIEVSSQASQKMVKIAFAKTDEIPEGIKVTAIHMPETINPLDETTSGAFADAINMHIDRIPPEDIVLKISDTYNLSIQRAATIHELATKKYEAHKNELYRIATVEKKASEYLQVKPEKEIEAKNVSSGKMEKLSYKPNEILKESDKPDQRASNVFQLWDVSSGVVKGLYQINPSDDSLQPVGVNDAMQNYKRELAQVSYETGLSDNAQNDAAHPQQEGIVQEPSPQQAELEDFSIGQKDPSPVDEEAIGVQAGVKK